MEIITIIILFLFCTLLLAAELFILPGTGVAGIAAICCLVGANYFTFVWFGLTTGLWLSAASLVACILVGYWMLRSKTLEKYSLHKSIDSTAATQDQLSVQPGDEGVPAWLSSAMQTSEAGWWKSNLPTVFWTKVLP